MDLAWILRATFRTSDIVGRLGGDEFVVLAPDADGYTDLLRERLRTAINQFNARAERAYQISISIGLSTCDSESVGLEELVQQADERMYEDKRVRGARKGLEAESVNRGTDSMGPVSEAPVSPRTALQASRTCLPPPKRVSIAPTSLTSRMQARMSNLVSGAGYHSSGADTFLEELEKHRRECGNSKP